MTRETHADGGNVVEEIERTDFLPPAPELNLSVPGDREDLESNARADEVEEVLQTLAENGIDDRETLITFGKRMANLIFHGGLTPSEAKAKAADDIFGDSGSVRDVAELLNLSKGGYWKIKGNAVTAREDARRLAVMELDSLPMNLLDSRLFAGGGSADVEVRYYLLEVVNPSDEQNIMTPRGPDIAPPEPQYAVVREVHAPDDFGTFQSLDIEYYLDGEALVEDLYEGETFQSEDQAELWRDWLEDCGFETESSPFDRLRGDIQKEKVEEFWEE